MTNEINKKIHERTCTSLMLTWGASPKNPCTCKPTHNEKILEEFDEEFIGNKMDDLLGSYGTPKNIRLFISQALLQVREDTLREVGEIAEGMKRGVEFSEPRLYQHDPTPNEMGGYSSVPFMCSLCFMSESDIQDNKLEVEYIKGEKEFEYACQCSVWDSPCGGKWVRWYDEDKARKLAEEYPCEDNFRNQVLFDLLLEIKSLTKSLATK